MEDKEKKVYCENCGVVRIDEIDSIETEKEARITGRHICPVCSCPHIKILE